MLQSGSSDVLSALCGLRAVSEGKQHRVNEGRDKQPIRKTQTHLHLSPLVSMLFMFSPEQVPVFKTGTVYSFGLLFIFNVVILESFSFQHLLSKVVKVEHMLSFFLH